jgi:DNA-damage-inducible protein J
LDGSAPLRSVGLAAWLSCSYIQGVPKLEIAMPAKTDVVRARIEPALKQDAEAVFRKLGLSHSQAIAMFYRQVTLQHGLPFDIRVPNEITLAALREAENPGALQRYASVDELFDELGRE